ncbi:MAG: histidine--tRNA ligase [Verrucomicrobia bacterium]|nr:MAG: histidine--tRNA ligase [Verrucomicrobiota bacterium]PYJ35906.1 MAG: histidine--tRNA ligase [Verrucomicrobiota bacterium]
MQALPGFRDFLPEDYAKRNYIFACWREVARRYGFVEWEGPPLESTELYKKKSGAEIVDQLFNFTDKGEREVALRPELTPTLARVVAAHERQFKKPLKWFSLGQFFRYEKQQRGRLREHFQLNCDIIGESDLAADIELVALCIDVLRAFGFTEKDFVVRISDREFWTDFLHEKNVPAERWDELLQAIDKFGREPREKTAEKLGDLAEPVFATLKSGGKSQKLSKLLDALRGRGLADFVAIDIGIVRGLAYYTGIVFEVFDRAGKFRAIAGGGRYDNLVAQLSNGTVSMPALGFAMGDVVLGELINEIPLAREAMEKAITNDAKIDIYIVIAKEERRADALKQIQHLRDAGYRVDYPLTSEKVGKQFQTAEQLGARVAVLFGDEWPQLKIKDMTTGEQQLVTKDNFTTRIESILR